MLELSVFLLVISLIVFCITIRLQKIDNKNPEDPKANFVLVGYLKTSFFYMKFAYFIAIAALVLLMYEFMDCV